MSSAHICTYTYKTLTPLCNLYSTCSCFTKHLTTKKTIVWGFNSQLNAIYYIQNLKDYAAQNSSDQI